jgi:thiol-disulfide isomerase/thioredoxin
LFFSNLPKIETETWLNCEEAPDLTEKIVLVDFFTYSCVNCIRTFKHLQSLYKKYSSLGLVIVGVHTPEFEFEKNIENVKEALEKYKIEWPVAVDNNLAIWQEFSNKYWPSKYLANTKGKIIYSHFGEGSYLETENEIRALLGLDPIAKEDFHIDDPLEGSFCIKPTPETYLGSHRGKPQQDQELVYDIAYNFAKTDNLDDDRFSLSGQFVLMSEFVESVNYNSKVYLKFSGTEVNLVVIPVAESCKIQIRLDGEPLLKKHYGKDLNENGELEVTSHRMYNLIKSKEGLTGEITLIAHEGNFRAFAFTFSGCD